MNDALGTARSYADLQPILRARADALGLSRVELDRIAGVPAGYSSKVLAEVPLRQLGPDTLGPMVGALAVKLIVVEDPEALAKHTARGDKRVEKYALNAGKHGGAVHFKISLRKLRQNGRKGGANSRKFLGKRMARKLARKAANARWNPPATHAANTCPAIAPPAAVQDRPPRIAGTAAP